IATDQHGCSRGFAFVNFADSSMAQTAIAKLNGITLDDGKQLCVCFFKNKKDREEELRTAYIKSCEDRNLYISNLDESIDDEKLKEAFSHYGKITSAKVMIKHGRSQGYGFVCFSTADEANKAINEMNGKELCLKPIFVTINKRSRQTRASSCNRYPPRIPTIRTLSTARSQPQSQSYYGLQPLNNTRRQVTVNRQYPLRARFD
ncbi:unnamed protein product, partial [Rotaria sordida]